MLGGSVLELAGIRKAVDIDLVTVPTNTDALLKDKTTWRKETRTMRRIQDRGTFTRTFVADTDNRFDIWQQWYDARRPLNNRQVYVPELIQISMQHDAGFWVVNLSEMLAMKAASGREKDALDVQLAAERL